MAIMHGMAMSVDIAILVEMAILIEMAILTSDTEGLGNSFAIAVRPTDCISFATA